MNQLVKIHQHCCKELLYISKVATFESDRMKTNTTKLQNFIDVCMVGGGGQACPATIQTSVKFRDFFAAISSLVSDISLSNLASLLILRRSL